MAHSNMHRNTGRQSEHIPYVVIVQSALYDSYRRSVVVPLVRGTVLRGCPRCPIKASPNAFFSAAVRCCSSCEMCAASCCMSCQQG